MLPFQFPCRFIWTELTHQIQHYINPHNLTWHFVNHHRKDMTQKKWKRPSLLNNLDCLLPLGKAVTAQTFSFFCLKTFAIIPRHVIGVCQHQCFSICVTLHDVCSNRDGGRIFQMVTCYLIPHLPFSTNSLELDIKINKHTFRSVLLWLCNDFFLL